MKNIKRIGKRGNAWVSIASGFAVGLIALAVVAIVISAFKGTQTSGTPAYNVLNNTETFMLNATNQLGTAGTILGVMAIVAIIAVFGFMGYQKYQSR
jgi:amino acid transporter